MIVQHGNQLLTAMVTSSFSHCVTLNDNTDCPPAPSVAGELIGRIIMGPHYHNKLIHEKGEKALPDTYYLLDDQLSAHLMLGEWDRKVKGAIHAEFWRVVKVQEVSP